MYGIGYIVMIKSTAPGHFAANEDNDSTHPEVDYTTLLPTTR